MALTDTAVKNAKPVGKSSKLYDSNGLYLEISPKGGKWWRFRYRFAGKEKLISLGVYPEVKLKLARERRDEMRKLVADGVDPSVHRRVSRSAQAESAANSFEVVGREWLEKHGKDKVPAHVARILRRLERDIFPWIGRLPIADIKASEILKCLRRIEDRGALATAHRALQNCGQIMRYAVATTRTERDITVDLRGALAPVQETNFAAITEPERVGTLLQTLDGYSGTFVVKSALRLAPLVFVRPGELRKAQWSDIDLKTGEWRYDVTKTNTQHIVPLAKQALAILKELQPLTGESQYVFPSGRGFARPMSDNAILAALRRMDIPSEEMCGHGFRAMARTILDEVLNFPVHLIEHQLAHKVRDANGRAYNRTAHLPQRKAMMQAWADYLDELKTDRGEAGLKQ